MQKWLVSVFMMVALLATGSSGAQAGQTHFFRTIEGQWRGSGEVVAGKYKGTRFNCHFTGLSEGANAGLSLDGSCRMGIFSQAVKARVVRGAEGGFLGHFNDGAKGEGMDIVAGSVGADHVTLSLHREQLRGSMRAQLSNADSMQIILSFKVSDHFIPVIGVNLQRERTVSLRKMVKK